MGRAEHPELRERPERVGDVLGRESRRDVAANDVVSSLLLRRPFAEDSRGVVERAPLVGAERDAHRRGRPRGVGEVLGAGPRAVRRRRRRAPERPNASNERRIGVGTARPGARLGERPERDGRVPRPELARDAREVVHERRPRAVEGRVRAGRDRAARAKLGERVHRVGPRLLVRLARSSEPARLREERREPRVRVERSRRRVRRGGSRRRGGRRERLDPAQGGADVDGSETVRVGVHDGEHALDVPSALHVRVDALGLGVPHLRREARARGAGAPRGARGVAREEAREPRGDARGGARTRRGVREGADGDARRARRGRGEEGRREGREATHPRGRHRGGRAGAFGRRPDDAADRARLASRRVGKRPRRRRSATSRRGHSLATRIFSRRSRTLGSRARRASPRPEAVRERARTLARTLGRSVACRGSRRSRARRRRGFPRLRRRRPPPVASPPLARPDE